MASCRAASFPTCAHESASFLRGLDFPGYAIGGLSVGETKEQMHAMLEVVTPLLPQDKPRYLMGVGSPEDLFEGVSRGVDLFDCVLPTRVARNGGLLTRRGRINLRNARFAEDPAPIEEGCDCYTCRHFSRAYLRHLLKANEIFGLRLATLHNLRFMLRTMAEIRQSILDGTFVALQGGVPGAVSHRARRGARRPTRAPPFALQALSVRIPSRHRLLSMAAFLCEQETGFFRQRRSHTRVRISSMAGVRTMYKKPGFLAATVRKSHRQPESRRGTLYPMWSCMLCSGKEYDMNWLTLARWSPYAVGAGMGIVTYLAFLLSDRSLGCSTAFARTAGMIEGWFRGDKVKERPYFQKFAPVIEWGWMLVLGVVIGAFISSDGLGQL